MIDLVDGWLMIELVHRSPILHFHINDDVVHLALVDD
jgi:hypothetical protein